jgi:hypothetical protein
MASRGQRIACLLAAAALALPSAAWGQGAGDEQYQDPFGDEDGQTGGGQDDQDQADDQGDAGTGAEAPESSGGAEPAPVTAQPPPAAESGGEQLAYTGVEVGLVALAGAALLASGLALRRRTSRRADRA